MPLARTMEWDSRLAPGIEPPMMHRPRRIMAATTHPGNRFLREPTEPNEPESGESLPQRDLQTLVGGRCCDCDKPYSAREAVFSIFLGLRNTPRCLPCVGRSLARPQEELWSDLLAHIRTRDCYLQAWHEAERIDGASAAGAAATRSLAR